MRRSTSNSRFRKSVLLVKAPNEDSTVIVRRSVSSYEMKYGGAGVVFNTLNERVSSCCNEARTGSTVSLFWAKQKGVTLRISDQATERTCKGAPLEVWVTLFVYHLVRVYNQLLWIQTDVGVPVTCP